MAQDNEVIRFHNSALFVGRTGVVKFDTATIEGVSLITGETDADGHNLWIDGVTLSQLHALGSKMGQIPVTLDHGAGITSINGFVDSVRLDGNKWRGDWHLLKSHKETETMLERADRQPSTFGMSVAFKGPPKGVLCEGKACARAERLLSVDCVTRPAANKDGLFGAIDEPHVDTEEKVNMSKPADKEPTLAEVMEAINGLKGNFDQMKQVQDQLVDHINQGAEDGAQGDETFEILSALNSATDAELAERGLTRAEVAAAVAEYNAGVSDETQGEGEGEAGDGTQHAEGEAGSNGAAPAMAGVSNSAPTTFAAMQRELVQLRSKFEAKELAEKRQVEELQFAKVEDQIVTLATREQAAIQLAEKMVAKCEALEIAFKTGTRPVRPGLENGVRLFSANEDGELHPWQAKIKKIELERKVTPGEAIMLADKEDNGAMHKDYINSLAGAPVINA